MQPARRGILTVLAAVGLFVVATGWIAVGGALAPQQARYVEAVIGEPQRISPLAPRANDAESDLVALIFSGLTRITNDGRPELDLAEAWEVTPDGLTYTFRLREGVTWHDGVPFTAHDVAYTIERTQVEDFDGPEALQASWRGVQVFVADERTVLLRLPEPAADFLVRASLGLVPRHLDERLHPEAGFEAPPFGREPVGTGPYRLIALDARRAVLERNLDYVHDSPSIHRIELRFVEDAAEQLELLQRGEVDAALLGEQPSDLETAALEVREDLDIAVMPRSAFTILYFNNNAPPLDDPALRRALAASIDREALIAAAGHDRLSAGDGVIVPQSWAYEAHAGGQSPDVEALWALSGWERNASGRRARGEQELRLELITNVDPHREALASMIANQLGAYGVAVDVIPVPAARVIAEHLRPGEYDLALFGWEAGADPDPYAGWHASQVGTGGNVAGYRDAEADALLEAARTTLDEGERRELYSLFARRFAEQAPSVVLAYPQRLYAHPANLRGLEPGLLFSTASRFRDVHRWELR
jgi:peptide/nickel transport system substrate-binding protein